MTTDQLENELCSVFTRSAADITVSDEVRTRLLAQDYHPRKLNRGLVAGITAIVAAVGIATPLAATAFGSQSSAAGLNIKLESYTFRMPAGYKRALMGSAACQTFAVYAINTNGYNLTLNGPGQPDQVLPHGQEISAAASSSGGCIVLTLTPAYAPTAATPDPKAPRTAQPVHVGSYHGLLFESSIRAGTTGRVIMSATELYVQIPVSGGHMRDLVIGATRLSNVALIKIATEGLSS